MKKKHAPCVRNGDSMELRKDNNGNAYCHIDDKEYRNYLSYVCEHITESYNDNYGSYEIDGDDGISAEFDNYGNCHTFLWDEDSRCTEIPNDFDTKSFEEDVNMSFADTKAHVEWMSFENYHRY